MVNINSLGHLLARQAKLFSVFGQMSSEVANVHVHNLITLQGSTDDVSKFLFVFQGEYILAAELCQ